MPKYQVYVKRDYRKRVYGEECGYVTVEAADEDTAKKYIEDLLEDSDLEYVDWIEENDNDDVDYTYESQQIDDDTDPTVNTIARLARYTAPEPEPEEEEEETDEDEEEAAVMRGRRVVGGVTRFWSPPEPYWWRSKYPDGTKFDLNDSEHLAFLRAHGVAQVQLASGGLADVQTREEWEQSLQATGGGS